MSEYTLSDLTGILRECAGEDDGALLQADVLDLDFGDLGYDSIALMETAGHVRIKYGVRVDEAAVLEARTPREFLRLVNSALSAAPR